MNEKALQQRVLRQTRLRLQSALLDLLHTSIAFRNITQVQDGDPVGAGLRMELNKEAYIEIVDQVRRLPALLKASDSVKEEARNRLMRLKARLSSMNMYEHAITAYHKMIKNTFEMKVYNFSAALASVPPPPAEHILQELNHYVSDAGSRSERSNRTNEILSRMPVKMTRDRFEAYVADGLARLQENTEVLYRNCAFFRACFFPGTCEGLEKYYPGRVQELDAKWDRLRDMKDQDNAEELESSLREDFLLVFLENTVNFQSWKSLNCMLLLIQYAPDLDTLLPDQATRDLYQTFIEQYEAESWELYEDTMTKRLQNALDELRSQIETGDDDLDFGNPGLAAYQMIRRLQEGLPSIDYMELPEDFAKYSRQDIINDFIKSLRESLRDLDPQKRRAVRQLILDYIPVPFSDRQYTDYIRYVYENLDDTGKWAIHLWIESLVDHNHND